MEEEEESVIEEDEPLSELEGEPDESIIEATKNFSVPPERDEGNLSFDDQGIPVVRTEVEITFSQDASVKDVNQVLDRHNARIVDMLPGLPFVIVRIPDPGNMEELRDVVSGIETEQSVEGVQIERILNSASLPPNVNPIENGSVNDLGIALINHHLAARVHAAWNLRSEIANDAPWLVIADRFGDGVPDERFAGDFKEPADFGETSWWPPADWFVDSHHHGYQVLGIINAKFGDSGPTGIFPERLSIRAVDQRSVGRTQNEIIRKIKTIKEENTNPNIVLNTSIGSNGNKKSAVKWQRKVREGKFDLEDTFLHFSAAGNESKGTPPPAYKQSPPNYATLGPDIDDPLQNIFVVENRVTDPQSVPSEDAQTAKRPKPGCLYKTSSAGGTLSAMGEDAFTLGQSGPEGEEGSQEKTEFAGGTSMATPQAAGMALYMWAVNPSLEVGEVKSYIEDTARDLPGTMEPGSCRSQTPAPVIDAYDAVLAAGGGDARKALLDVTKDNRFDEDDIEVFLDEWNERDGQLDYSRYDLNGTGQTGGDATDRFDLSQDISFGTVTQTIEGETVEFDESALTDEDVLCYYAYSDLYGGDAQARADLLTGPCLGEEEVPERSYGPEHRYAPGDGYEYFVTVEEYDVNDDIPALLESKFGENAELAEWNNLKDLFSNDESALISFLDSIGMKRDSNGYVQNALVTRGGDRYHSTSMPRHYYVNRFDGDVPSGWLVHDDLHSNRLSLGSWDNDREAMVRVPESEEDPSAKE